MRHLFFIIIALLGLSLQAATPQEVIDRLKANIAPDKRTAIFNVTADCQGAAGTVGLREQYEAVVNALRDAGFNDIPINIKVLETSVASNRRWALVTNAVATLRAEGKHSAECETQCIMGMPLKVLEVGSEWCRVVCPDGYISWVPKSSISFRSDNGLNKWKQAKRYVVTVYSSRLTTTPGGDETVTDLTLSNILEWQATEGDYLLLSLPDGRKGYLHSGEAQELSQWAGQEFNPTLLEKTARRMMGSTYLWGGTSTKMTDCSGLTKVCYLANGIILQRDASQQTLTGTKISRDRWRTARTGDLVFFGNEQTGRVTHVGMYLRDGKVIHCSGRVKINSLDPKDSDYLKGYGFLSISRINGMVGTKGITAVKDHPWYF